MFDTKFKSIYSCNREFIPAVIVEEIDDDGNIHEALKIGKKKPRAPKYLPGERLLLKLNKQKQKKKHDRIKSDQIDINKIKTSVHNLLKIF